MKFWKKKEEIKSTNPFRDDLDRKSILTEYSQTPTAVDPRTKISSYAQDRNRLFNGHESQSMRSTYLPSVDEYNQDNSEEQVIHIQRHIRSVKQETLSSTRHALQRINQAESAAANAMNILGTQSTQIANIDRNLDMSKAYTRRASSQAVELKQLNRSIFIPVVKNPFTKRSRERKKLDRVQRDHHQHMMERNSIRQFEYDSNVRIHEAHTQAHQMRESQAFSTERSKLDRTRYQFEADAEDDAIEDEIDTNLDLLGDATARLYAMATGMNQELSSQNKHLSRVNKKVDPINEQLISTTYTLHKTR